MTYEKYFDAKTLLSTPRQRAAYSDRSAYICAELSRLAYFPFEGGSTYERLLDQVEKAMMKEGFDRSKIDPVKNRIGEQMSQDKLDETLSKDVFNGLLEAGGFELVGTFGENETQGFVCRRNLSATRSEAFLVYRGTESVGDVLDDMHVYLTTEPFTSSDDRSEIHSGFYGQYSDVDDQVKILLEQVEDQQLFITGHSLGGALAVLATRFYALNAGGACYTFGAPAVGNPAFQRPIKTPIYRIVNEVDPVPRVPSAYTGFLVQFVVHWVYQLSSLIGISVTKEPQRLIRDLKQYRQNGYDSYLLAKAGTIVLRTGSSLDFLDKARFWLRQFQSKRMLLRVGDYHKMDNYVDRLKLWARSRNPEFKSGS